VLGWKSEINFYFFSRRPFLREMCVFIMHCSFSLSQVHIAPIQAQVQAQRVRTLAAQQANEQISTSKPLPITVPVTNLVSGGCWQITGIDCPVSLAVLCHTDAVRTQLNHVGLNRKYILSQGALAANVCVFALFVLTTHSKTSQLTLRLS